jgi:hypothetical protein
VALLVHGGDPRDVWTSGRSAPPEWLLYLILVLLLGGAGVASLYLSQRWRNRREETVLGGGQRKQHGLLPPHQAAARPVLSSRSWRSGQPERSHGLRNPNVASRSRIENGSPSC